MSVTMQSLGIDRLSIEDRLELVHEIWNSIAAESAPLELSAELRAELDRRIAEDDAEADNVIPWEQVREELLAKLRSR